MKYLFKQPFFYTGLFSLIALGLIISSYHFGGNTNPYAFGWTTPSTTPPGGNITGGGTPAGSTGYVQFNNAGVFGGDANLFWDNTNKRLGIGTASPAHQLSVGSATSDAQAVTIRGYSNTPASWKGGGAFGYTSASVILGELSGVAQIGGHSSTLNAWANLAINSGGGNVGIGTTAPGAKLEIAVNSWGADTEVLRINRLEGGWYDSIKTQMSTVLANNYLSFWISGVTDNSQSEVLRLVGNGNVGIGTTGPVSKLSFGSGGTSNNVNRIALSEEGDGTYFYGVSYLGNPYGLGLFAGKSTTPATPDLFVQATTGNVGIGTTAPGYKLDVSGDVRLTGNLIASANTLDSCAWTAYTCNASQTCTAPQIVAGVERYTTGALCGTSPTQWYQMRLYCCNI